MKRIIAAIGIACALGAPTFAQEDASPFIGYWALTPSGGGAAWLGVTQEKGYLDASVMWIGGSVRPAEFVHIEGNTLVVTRMHKTERKNEAGEVVRTQSRPEVIMAVVDGDTMHLKRTTVNANGLGVSREEFTGKRNPPMPPAPDLSTLTFGDPIEPFNGTNLDGWELTNPDQVNGWRAENGELVNEPIQEEGQPHKSYGNLRTVPEFEDFNLTLEINVPAKGNSGIYLRGIYEVQVEDSHGEPLADNNMGGIYSRIAPSVAAEKPAGEWQTYDITLVDRHVTVILNGVTILDNVPLLGCTGGALWSDEFRPGPIYFQGDHTGVRYRNIILKPVVR